MLPGGIIASLLATAETYRRRVRLELLGLDVPRVPGVTLRFAGRMSLPGVPVAYGVPVFAVVAGVLGVAYLVLPRLGYVEEASVPMWALGGIVAGIFCAQVRKEEREPRMSRETAERVVGQLRTLISLPKVRAVAVAFSDERAAMAVLLEDGRHVDVPLHFFPKLLQATHAQRANLRMIGGGEGIHWPDLDEDLAVSHFLAPHSLERPANARDAREGRP